MHQPFIPGTERAPKNCLMQLMEVLSSVGQTEDPGWSGVPGWSIIPGPHAGAGWLAKKSEFRGSNSNERSPQGSWDLGPHEQSCVLPVPWGTAQSAPNSASVLFHPGPVARAAPQSDPMKETLGCFEVLGTLPCLLQLWGAGGLGLSEGWVKGC